ncbi:MAG: methylmalonyl-CoA carboxyltransferase [Erysipelotrichaceae bacterium]|nr:methylmalonyl-CoA carboxyltransferase [Erysipelotrichaceae bacterium]
MNKIDDLKERKKVIALGGGEKAIEKQHASGKLTARERIAMLLDEGSFEEIDAFVTHRCTDFGMASKKTPADGVVCGFGLINGRRVCVYAQDFTVLGGSLGEMHAKKITKIQDLAIKAGVPLIGMNDSGGARVQEGIAALQGYGEIFARNISASGVIPQISVILGPCAGGATYSPALTDFILMVNNVGRMFITGPDVIKTVTGEEIEQETLGGARTHNEVSGVAHYMSDSEEECFDCIRELLSYLPQNNMETTPEVACDDDVNRLCPELDTIIPEQANKAYDMKKVIESLSDNGTFMEYQPLFARNLICGYMRLDGKSVGVIANQPNMMGGSLDIDASDKGARFIRTCDAFNIPLLTLQDVPGFLPGSAQEYGGIIRHGAKMLYAYGEATVPKITVITRKGFGGSYIAMCCKALGGDLVYAWPSAQIAVMGASGAANIVFRKEIKAADDPAALRVEKIKEYEDTVANPYVAGSLGYIDDVIVPSKTRQYIINAFDMLSGKRVSTVSKKHGNIPL